MSTVGFIGLGAMGAPMARNLLKAGHQLHFFARRPELVREFEDAGGTAHDSPAAVTEASEFIIAIVTADPQVEEVALGKNGILSAAAAGKMYIDMSTISPDTVRRVGSQLEQAGMTMLDAPVSGGPWGAEAGTLAIMVGGAEADVERARPLLLAMGDPEKVIHVGPLGAGQTAKLVNQMMAGSIMTLIGEAFLIARRAGIDLDKLADVVAGSSGNSAVFGARGRKFLLADNYEPGFKCDLMHKDMRLAIELGQRLNVPTPVAVAALQQYTATLNQGHAAKDFAAVVKAYETATGVQIVDQGKAAE